MKQELLALYGLKWNPFSPEQPTEAIYVPAKLENFCWRIEHAQIREGGFAMTHGDPGTGKSIALRLLADRLARLPDVTVGAINHPFRRATSPTYTGSSVTSSPCRCARTTVAAASRSCANAGMPISKQRADAPCLSSTRRRR